MDERQFDQLFNFSPLIFRDNEEIFFKMIIIERSTIFTIFMTLEYNPSYDMIIESDIHTICKRYLKSIEWTFPTILMKNRGDGTTDIILSFNDRLNEYLKENSLSYFKRCPICSQRTIAN